MGFKWRKWNRAIHRDFGYLFFGMTIIYALSGIALNHVNDWNPNFIINNYDIHVGELPGDPDKEKIKDLLASIGEEGTYKKHFYPRENFLKIFIDGGTVEINTITGDGFVETIKRRPVFHAVNYLHYNPSKWWTHFSDLYSIALMLLAITGLFILRGKLGITGRGAWLTILGTIIPLIFLWFYLS